jgi:putative addiction module component (TIGR02574 family)
MKAIQELRSLPVAERIQLVEDLWDSIAEDSGSLQLTDAQRTELDRRLDDFEAAPGAGDSWEAVKRKLQRKP